jgi:hypothetical protein
MAWRKIEKGFIHINNAPTVTLLRKGMRFNNEIMKCMEVGGYIDVFFDPDDKIIVFTKGRSFKIQAPSSQSSVAISCANLIKEMELVGLVKPLHVHNAYKTYTHPFKGVVKDIVWKIDLNEKPIGIVDKSK